MNDKVRVSIEGTIADMERSKNPLTEERIRKIVREEIQVQESAMFKRFVSLMAQSDHERPDGRTTLL